jgi:hypothetical protein
MSQRPVLVTVIAGLLFLAGAIAVIGGTAIVFPTSLADRMWEWNTPGAAVLRAIGPTSGVFLWILRLAVFAAALGLLRGRRLARRSQSCCSPWMPAVTWSATSGRTACSARWRV